MLLEIDINYLNKHQITAHHFIILKLVNDGDLRRLRGYLLNTDSYGSLPEVCRTLHKLGLIVDPPSDPLALSTIKVSSKFRSTLSFVDDPFEEFYKAYPTKVLRPNGDYDYLRIDQKRSKKIYHNIIRMNIEKHQFILNCLKHEIKDKTARGQMSFFKRMPAWLTSESWKAYADLADSQVAIQDDNTASYGQDIE